MSAETWWLDLWPIGDGWSVAECGVAVRGVYASREAAELAPRVHPSVLAERWPSYTPGLELITLEEVQHMLSKRVEWDCLYRVARKALREGAWRGSDLELDNLYGAALRAALFMVEWPGGMHSTSPMGMYRFDRAIGLMREEWGVRTRHDWRPGLEKLP